MHGHSFYGLIGRNPQESPACNPCLGLSLESWPVLCRWSLHLGEGCRGPTRRVSLSRGPGSQDFEAVARPIACTSAYRTWTGRASIRGTLHRTRAHEPLLHVHTLVIHAARGSYPFAMGLIGALSGKRLPRSFTCITRGKAR